MGQARKISSMYLPTLRLTKLRVVYTSRFAFTILFLLFLNIAHAQSALLRPLGQGLPAMPSCVYSNGETLYASYPTTFTGNGRIWKIARWNGAMWQNLPELKLDSAGDVQSMIIYNNQLYLGGNFTKVNGIANSAYLVRFSNGVWERIGSGFSASINPSNRISKMEVYRNQLFIGGQFSRLNSDTFNNVACFDGTNWKKLPLNNGQNQLGMPGAVIDFAIHNDSLFITGNFNSFNGQSTGGLVCWDSTRLINVQVPFRNSKLIKSFQGKLYCFGLDTTVFPAKFSVFAMNGSWNKINQNLQDITQLYDFEVQDSVLYAVGNFKIANQLFPMVRFNGFNWMPEFAASSLIQPLFLQNFREQLIISGNLIGNNSSPINNIASLSRGLGRISGRVFQDMNADCIFGSNDRKLGKRLIQIMPDNIVLYTDANGLFDIVLPPKTYQVSLLPTKYFTPAPCNPANYSVTIQAGLVIDTVDFALVGQNNINDLKVNLTSNAGWTSKKGSTESYTITITNVGTNEITAGNVNLVYSKPLQSIQADPPTSNQTARTASWIYAALKPGEERTIKVDLKINQDSVSLNESISFSTFVYGTATDNFDFDNYDTLTQRVESNLPITNGKQVFPTPAVNDTVTYVTANENELEYLVNFENTSLDTITTIYVIDTIDLNIDMQYIQETGSSHNYTTRIYNCPPTLGKGVIVWTFNNIKLPPNPFGPNTDYTKHKGHVGFKVRFNSSLPIGTMIKNKAHIVFDYQNPLATNNTYAKVTNTTGLIKNVEERFTRPIIFPNPANQIFSLQLADEENHVHITDISGRTVFEMNALEDKVLIPCQHWASGIYVVTICTSNSIHTSKLYIQH